jgi:integrase
MKRKREAGRPSGAQSQVISVPGSIYLYRKPFQRFGKWRCRRIARADGTESMITLPEASTLGEAIQDATKMAEQEAHEAAQAALPAAERDLVPVTLKAGWDAWLAMVKGTAGLRESTAKDYAATGKRILAALGETREAHAITLKDIETLMLGLAKHAARTRLKYLEMLDRLFAYLAKHGHARGNPVAGFEAPRTWRKEIKRSLRETGRALTVGELRLLVAAAGKHYRVDTTPEKFRKTRKRKKTVKRAPHPDMLTAVLLAALAGLRKGNIVGPAAVTWGDLDLKAETMDIDAGRMKGKERLQVPLSAELAEHLRERRAALGRVAGPVVNLVDFKHSWESLVKRCGVADHFRFHDLRHSLASLLGAVAPGFVVAKILGHAGADGAPSVTSGYVHVHGDPVRHYLNQVPRLLGGSQKSELA